MGKGIVRAGVAIALVASASLIAITRSGAEDSTRLEQAARRFAGVEVPIAHWNDEGSDAIGDNPPDSDPRGDITFGSAFSVDDRTAVRFTLRPKQPEPPTTSAWVDFLTVIFFYVDQNRDHEADIAVMAMNLDGPTIVVINPEGQVQCTAPFAYDGTDFSTTVAKVCLGLVVGNDFGWAAEFDYETENTLSVDFFPDKPVTTTPTPTTPTPTTPTPTTPTPTTPPAPGDVMPQGSLDAVNRSPGSARLIGWAVDRNVLTAPINVHIYLNGENVSQTTAGSERPDVAAAVPGAGGAHGFDVTIPIATAGPHKVCAYGINDRAGATNKLLGCKAVITAPLGHVDSVDPSPAGLRVAGWAVDPDTAEPAAVHVYVDGKPAAATLAGSPRPDLERIFPAHGPNHGFAVELGIVDGKHTVCAYAIDGVIGAQNVQIGCTTLTVSRLPIGSLDQVTRAPGGFRVAGWAIDPDTTDVVDIHIYADGRLLQVVKAGAARADIGARYPTYGANHGFDATVGGNGSRVCAYAINQGAGGGNRLLACKGV